VGVRWSGATEQTRRHTEVIRPAQLGLAGRQTHLDRQLQRPLRGHRGIHRGPLGEENGAHTPSPVCLNMKPPCVSIAERNVVCG
jgi:hypothetical protein